MARSTLSSRFRRLDIDQYDENRFVEEPEEAAAAEPDASPEVEALLRQGEALRAFHTAIRSSPGSGRNQAMKVRAGQGQRLPALGAAPLRSVSRCWHGGSPWGPPGIPLPPPSPGAGPGNDA
ncbi:actin-related protein 2/3 complex subunit 5-like protein isoform X2 [Pyrgilauda ruficollis]|uniref:actin-related protein 2/3 complex subunit 5-like protein isoform X2 n=1 Tax=Pyrgilauda ruficollis TaxID=221976 RepID=UPI001B8762C2|nr:actin-related protein 2/3 complex subunit 5-like protein isoform X2 [Pyrgilauda ruficollis]